MKEVWRYGDKGKLFNPLRGWERILSHPELHTGLLLFNPCRGFESF